MNNKILIEMEDIKNIIQKSLFNAIKDKINEREKLITEMWSYSDQMDNTMDYVYDILTKNIHNSEMHKLDYGIGLRRGIIKNLTLFGIDDITFEYYIYECRDNETCRYIINNAFSENDYSENEKHAYDKLHRPINRAKLMKRRCESIDKNTNLHTVYESIESASRGTGVSCTQIRRIAEKECINLKYDFKIEGIND